MNNCCLAPADHYYLNNLIFCSTLDSSSRLQESDLGGGGGIGRSVCRVMADKGATVVAADIDYSAAQETISQLQGNCPHLALECDVSNSVSVKKCFETAIEKLSQPPTLLAHTAGITRDAFITKMSEDDFDKVIDVNLKGTFLLTQALARTLALHTREGEDPIPGSIVTFSSIVAKNGNIGQCNYTAAKAGVEAFTKTAAKELARQNIRINCILPGFIDTPMTETVPEHLMQMFIQVTPMKRMGRPEEIADAVAYFLSDSSSFVTGSSLLVTGGMAGTV